MLYLQLYGDVYYALYGNIFALQLYVSLLFFVIFYPRRNSFVFRAYLSTVGYFLLVNVIWFFIVKFAANNEFINIIFFFLCVVFLAAGIFVSFRINILGAIYYATGAYAVQHAAYSLGNIIKYILLNQEIKAEQIFNPMLEYCNAGIIPYEYNINKANEILENAGWKKKGLYREKDGIILSIDMHYIGIDPKQKAIAEILQADLMNVGIKLNLSAEESTIFYSLQSNGSFDMIFNKTWGPPFEPGTFAGSMRKPSHADYQAQSGLKEKEYINNMIDKLIVSDNTTFIAEKYEEILNIFHNEAVYLPISYELDLALVRKDRVKNFQFGNMVTEFMLHTLEPYND